MESIRMTLVFFAISGLDVMGSLDDIMSPEDKKNAIKWIYSLQVPPPEPRSEMFRHGFPWIHYL